MHVIKRDGTVAVFNQQKIFDAVYKACKATSDESSTPVAIALTSRSVTDAVMKQCKELDQANISVETIQDMVEAQLMSVDKAIAKNYILYRQRRTEVRQMKSEIFTTIEQFMTPDISDMDEKRENANIDSGSTMGAMLKIGGTATKTFNLTKLISPKYARMHREGKWHIHDLDFFGLSCNCAYIPADKLLDHGFSTGHGSLRSPSTIGTAATQAAIIIQSNQNDMFGGQSIPNFDYALAPYVAKSYVRNCMQYLEIRCDSKKEELKETLEKPLFNYIKEKRHILTDEGYEKLHECVEQLPNHPLENDQFSFEKMKEYALQKTDTDTYQAMEGMIHNFCSLACLHPDQGLWVYDRLLGRWSIDTAAEFYNKFMPGRYCAMSVNETTQEVEFQPITAISELPNTKSVVFVKNDLGAYMNVTYDHRCMVIDEDGKIDYKIASELTHTVAPVNFTIPTERDFTKEWYDIKVQTPVRKVRYRESTISYTPELAALCGLYLRSGGIVTDANSGVTKLRLPCDLTMYPADPQFDHASEMNKIFRMIDTVFDKFSARTGIEYIEEAGNVFIEFFIATEVKETFKTLCGTDTTGMHIPAFIMHGSDDIRAEFFNAFVRYSSKHGKENCFYIRDERVMMDYRLLQARQHMLVKAHTSVNGLWEVQNGHLGISGNLAGEDEKLITIPVDCNVATGVPTVVYDIEVLNNHNFMLDSGIVVHNSRAGSQVPFSSINYGTDTTNEGRMVIKNVLLATKAGLGNGETAIFPISVFRMRKGITDKGSTNYDLFKLACEVSALRLYPETFGATIN